VVGLVRRVTSVYIDEDDLIRLVKIIDELGYRSLSEFFRDVVKEVISTYEILSIDKRLTHKPQAKRKLILTSIFRKLFK